MPRPSEITGALRPLIDYCGGVLAFAKVMGVTRRTVLRWGQGETTPVAYVCDRVNRMARRIGVREPYVKGRLRKGRA